MKRTIFLIMLLATHTAFAEKFTTTIHSIALGKKGEPHLVRFDNGRASFLSQSNAELLNSLIQTDKNHNLLEVKVDRRNNIYAALTIQNNDIYVDDVSSKAWTSEPYKPSILNHTNTAIGIFNKMRKDYTKDGECYNRAHIWSYEEYKRSGLHSMKIFMFFTEKYIRNYKFHWWFHVTPMSYVASLSSPRTLDRRYTSGPRQTKIWSDVFIKSKRTCKKVNTFDEYYENQMGQDCYHIYTSMYYVIPRDIEKRDITGLEKSEFLDKEIKRAYRNGFNK
jgi:hypothetical protein